MVLAQSRLIEGWSVEEVDDFLAKVTRDIGIEAGTVCRIARQYLHNWLNGASNIDEESMDTICDSSQAMEWKNGGRGLDFTIHNAIRAAGLDKDNRDLNSMVAEMAVSILLSMHDGKRVFEICDIGAGTGETTKAFLKKIIEVRGEKEGGEFISRFVKLRLIDPSMHRLVFAFDSITSSDIRPLSFMIEPSGIGNYFPSVVDGKVDMVISSAALHHMPSDNYLKDIYRKTAPDGVMVMGDWHHSVFSHPAMILPLLSAKGYTDNGVAAYKRFFGIKEGDFERIEKQLTLSEREDNAAVIRFLAALADCKREVPGADFHFFEATESFRERKAKLAAAGFEIDMEELRQKHRGFLRLTSNISKAFPGRDLANVIAVAKIPRHLSKSR